MKYVLPLLLLAAMACQPSNELDKKKTELTEARAKLQDAKDKVHALETEIKALDPEFEKTNNAVSISTWKLNARTFEHFVDVRGAVESRKNVTLSAATGGKIEKVWVNEGQAVTAGQTLVTIESEILRNSLAELNSALDLARTVFEKQEKLWQQKIGTELQYLQAKNNKESLEKRVAVTKAQIDQTVVRAPFAGTIDKVDALVGELATPGVPLVRMVNPNDMYVKADVSENFIGTLKTGDKVEVFFPAFNKKVASTILSVGQVINPENRTFRVECRLVTEVGAKPNQVVVVSIRDYVNPNVFTVPTKIIQRDTQGTFVFISETKGEGLVARKVYIKPGLSYGNETEVLEGLAGTETVVFEGYREVTEGAELKAAEAHQKVASN
ncbi:MAG: efflux RND transporter periplasmic adaptor subunit [Cytophagales bacterium]|nr:efflux RND transporter periplasmic adaptor subunit [Cytophagales bacterium]